MTHQQNRVDLPPYKFLLDSVRLRVESEVGFICQFTAKHTSPILLASYASDSTQLERIIETLEQLHASEIPLERWQHLVASSTPFSSSLIELASLESNTLVLGVLSSADITYTEQDQDAVTQALSLASQDLENAALQKRLHDEHALNILRQVITEASNVQEIVDALRTHILSDHVGACSVLVYGPALRDVDLLEYVEIAGLWVRDVGSGYGIGTRVYLESHDTILEALHDDGILISNEELEARLAQDALLSGLIKSRLVQKWALIALHTPDQRVGLWLITSNRPDGFTHDEIDLYRQVGELLTQCLMLKSLQRDRATNAYGRTAILEAVYDGVLLTSPGTHGVVVSMMNQRFCDLFDYRGKQQHVTLNEVVQRMQVPPSIRQTLKTNWKSLPFRSSQTLHGDFEMISHQGHPQHIQWYSSPIYDPDDGTVFSRIFIFHDATPERAALQVRSAFLSRISHELRTPLTSISGFAQFILESDEDALTDTAREYVEIIHESAGRLKHIFSKLIEITRAYAGQLQLDLQPCDVESIVQSVVHLHIDAANRCQQTLTLDLMAGGIEIIADPKRVGQIVSHILENAILFTPHGGEIQVITRTISKEDDLPANSPTDLLLPALLFGVIDTGPGILSEDANAVFEPFHRTRVAMSRQIEGAGMGLTLAQTLVELHRGTIWVQPVNSGEIGGRIYFTVPISED
jgi:signal transduction histidine kinase